MEVNIIFDLPHTNREGSILTVKILLIYDLAFKVAQLIVTDEFLNTFDK